MQPLRRSFLIQWILACGLGELLGLSAAAVALWANARGGEPVSALDKARVLFSAVAAGALEGAITGTLQWLVLRRRYAALSGPKWVGATIAVAMSGWLAGMSVPLFLVAPDAGSPPPAEPSLGFIIAFSLFFGASAGALFGAAQAVALAPHVRRVWPWIAGNAAGFALGLPFTYVAGGVFSESPLVIAVVGGGSGLAMGLAVALATAVALRAMPARIQTQPQDRQGPPSGRQEDEINGLARVMDWRRSHRHGGRGRFREQPALRAQGGARGQRDVGAL